MPDSSEGRVERLDGSYVIHFERRFSRPVAAVWDALTKPEQLKDWVGAGEVEVDLVPGGRIVTRTTEPPEVVAAIVAEADEEALERTDTILRVEAPRLFEHTFGGSPTSIVRWELEPDGDGCLLRLSHTEPGAVDREGTSSFLAGWHDLLDMLGQMLEVERARWEPSSMERWEAYKARYAALIG
jgi:uncharacterized protein YndB with AHSA1/START domain